MSPNLLALALALGGILPPEPPAVPPSAAFSTEEESDLEREASAVAALAAELSGQGLEFPEIFRRLCGRSAAAGDRVFAFKAQAGGLMLWTERGGRPKLLGREDWGLHFIYGGWISAFFGLDEALTAAYEKERRDASSEGNAFDLGDLAVTYFGAHWTQRALADPARYPAPWAEGTRSLGSLPPLTLGKLPPRALPSKAELAEADAWAAGSL